MGNNVTITITAGALARFHHASEKYVYLFSLSDCELCDWLDANAKKYARMKFQLEHYPTHKIYSGEHVLYFSEDLFAVIAPLYTARQTYVGDSLSRVWYEGSFTLRQIWEFLI